MQTKKIRKIVFWSLGSLFMIIFLGILTIALHIRIKSSNTNRGYFSCSLNGKESAMVNCDKRSENFIISGNQISFVSNKVFNSVYIPFTANKIQLSINPKIQADYDFWILYDTFGWKELQWVDYESIGDSSLKNQEMTLRSKLNHNFIFKKDETGNSVITIDTRKPMLTQQSIGHIDFIKKSFLVQGRNPKGVIVMMTIPKVDQKVTITKTEINK